jgi:glycosyltransferase involved in cell wall biosynthesis
LDYDKHKEARQRISNYKKGNVLTFFENPEVPTLIFVGRLTKVKKIGLLLGAKSILDKSNFKTNLLIVGDGPEREHLESYAKISLEKGTFRFYGACYDEKTNEAFLACSDICISPGNVGLTAIHSLSYGTPVITHANFENQMPEVESIAEEKTGLFFVEGDENDLAEKIKLWLLKHKKDRCQIREECYKIIDQYYNPYYQVKVIENLVFNKSPLL